MYPTCTIRRQAYATRAATALALLAGLLLTAGCERILSGPKKVEDDQTRPDKIVNFDMLYGANCAGCHGPDGKNGSALPMNNPVYMAYASDALIRDITVNGQKGTLMPAFGAAAGGLLTDEQINALVAGMRQHWGAPVAGLTPPPYVAEGPGDAPHGYDVYTAGCASCHGPVPATGAATAAAGRAGSIVDPTFLALMSEQSMRTIVVAGRPDLGQPDWRGDIPGRPLTNQEITDVVAWMYSLRRPRPGQTHPALSQTMEAPSPARPAASELERRVQ